MITSIENQSLETFQSLAERVECIFESSRERALLWAYHSSQDPDFSNLSVRSTEISIKDTPSYSIGSGMGSGAIWVDGEGEIQTKKWSFTLDDSAKILKALYWMGLKRVPNKLKFIEDGVTKEKWREAYRLARSIQSGREEVSRFNPECDNYRVTKSIVKMFRARDYIGDFYNRMRGGFIERSERDAIIIERLKEIGYTKVITHERFR